MWASSQEQEEEARQKAKDAATGVKRYTLSPAALKRKAKEKKAKAKLERAAQRKAKTNG